MAPGSRPQPSGSVVNDSPRSVERLKVTQSPGRSTKKTLCVRSPTAWWLSPPPGPWPGLLPVAGRWSGSRQVAPPSSDFQKNEYPGRPSGAETYERSLKHVFWPDGHWANGSELPPGNG